MILNVVHTETQDGKSLLDAHFAHATFLVKRFLQRVRANKQNQVTSPGELVGALAYNGGLQNCGVQLVLFDGEVMEKLERIKEDDMMKKAVKKLKEYFGRCNEINYFPDDDSSDGKIFRIHAKAYSGASPGASFHVDLNDGKIDVIEGDSSVLVDFEEVHDDEDNNNWTDVVSEEAVENITEDSIIDEMGIDAVEKLIVGDTGSGLERKGKILESTNGNDFYDCRKFLTGVKVEKVMKLGNVMSTKGAAKKIAKNGKKNSNLGTSGKLSVVSRGVRCFKAQAFDEYGVQDGSDDKCFADLEMDPEFKVPERFVRKIGWARRPQRGKMYGKKYLKKYKSEIREWFLEGAKDSTKKMGPGIMLEQLRRKYPGTYRLPSFVELQSYIGQLFKLQKEGKLDLETGALRGETSGSNNDADDESVYESDSNGEDDEVEQGIRAAKGIIDAYGGLIEPKWVKMKIENQLEGLLTVQEGEVTKQITSLRNRWLKQRKRCIIG